MSLGRNVRVYQCLQPKVGILLEQRSNKDALLLEDDCAIVLSKSDADSLKSSYTKLCDAYGCVGVIRLHTHRGLARYLLLVTGYKSVGRILDVEVFKISDISFLCLRDGAHDPSSNTLSEMKRLLCSGSFHFTSLNNGDMKNNFNLEKPLQFQDLDNNSRKHFLWNSHLLSYFETRGITTSSWCFSIICGGIDIRTLYVGKLLARAAVICRLSCDRVGTRYNVRGADSSGNVANFVESEQIISIGDEYSSYIQLRGSVPLFWEQPGLNVGSHKVKMPMGEELNLRAFERHFDDLLNTYQNCCLVNLLGSKEGESSLTRAYQHHLSESKYSDSIPLISFDYHTECRVGKPANISKLLASLSTYLDQYGVTCSVKTTGGNDQGGVFRVNCLDCLDRTNNVQSYVGLHIITAQLKALGYENNAALITKFSEALKPAWQQTGDMISRMYAGTGALEGKDKVGKLKDGARSVGRAIQNNFYDQNKQETMDRLLKENVDDYELLQLAFTLLNEQQILCGSSSLLKEMLSRKAEFTTRSKLRVYMGTWNVNGGKLFRSIAYKDKTLKDWLFPLAEENLPTEKYYKAVYEYVSAEEGDLNLVVDDFITVNDVLENGEWFRGHKGEESGIFPASYVEEVLSPHLVIHDFPAQEDGDLEMWEHEIVDVLEVNGEWMKGKVLRNGEVFEGMFPCNFVTKIGGESKNSFADVYAIGFEEMVELNAGNIVNTSLANQQAWESELLKTISSEKQEYVLVTSEQLVGVCLFVFVKKQLAGNLSDTAVKMVKTGMGGTAGNKGAVGISFNYFSTSLCFICSHFAAGQTQVQERNNDFAEIANGLVFAKGRGVLFHDYVFWCGDFNFRIDMTKEEVKQLVKEENWEKLKEFDQLLVQKKMGNVFKGFNEGEVCFAPTYKYDLFSDDYDTSEKCRVPAWTDRVLWKKRNWFKPDSAGNGGNILIDSSDYDEEEDNFDQGTLIYYNREELKTSDHRPVIAIIDFNVETVDDQKRSSLHDEIVDRYQPINTPLFVYVEGKHADESMCKDFLQSILEFPPILTKLLPTCYIIVYAERWMANKVLSHDGTEFRGSVFRASMSNGNLIDDSVPDAAENVEMESLPWPEETNHAAYHNHMHVSRSSNEIAASPAPQMARPKSTPALNRITPPGVPKPPAKKGVPPPRPPAMRKPVKPPPPVFPTKGLSPELGVAVPLRRAPVASNEEFGGETPEGGFEPSSEAEEVTAAMAELDFSIFESSPPVSEPPKIKPRKTLPKRKAPPPPPKPAPKTTPAGSNPSSSLPLSWSLDVLKPMGSSLTNSTNTLESQTSNNDKKDGVVNPIFTPSGPLRPVPPLPSKPPATKLAPISDISLLDDFLYTDVVHQTSVFATPMVPDSSPIAPSKSPFLPNSRPNALTPVLNAQQSAPPVPHRASPVSNSAPKVPDMTPFLGISNDPWMTSSNSTSVPPAVAPSFSTNFSDFDFK